MVTAVALAALSWLMAMPPAAAKSRHGDHGTARSETPVKPPDDLMAAKVPLPEPRPAEAPQSRKAADGKGETAKGETTNSETAKSEAGKDEAAVPAAPPPPSACRVALTDELAVAPSVAAIHGPGACGGDDLVRLEAVVLPDKRKVALTPAATMRCTMATAVVNWIRSDVAPEVAKLGSEITALHNFDSYECRGRNGVAAAPMSEHGRANAIDVHGFKLADGRMIDLTDRTQPREFRETVLHSLCTRFPTVLGPDSDWHHEDHIHIDLIERRSNYRICQWDVLDPMPKVAPLMPEVRPDDAPPREIVETEPAQKKDPAGGKGGSPARDGGSTTGRSPARPATSDDSGTEQAKEKAAPSAKAAPDKAAPGVPVKDDATAKLSEKPSEKPSDKVPVAAVPDKTRGEPVSTATSATKSTPDATATAKRPTDRRPIETGTVGKTPTDKAADKAIADKNSADRDAADKPSTDDVSRRREPKGTAANDKSPKDKASASTMAAQKPAPRRRRHGRHDWNPFGALF